MLFYSSLDKIMTQDLGNRGFLRVLPPNPVAEIADSLKTASRVILLTGFPVRLGEDNFIGETDGPSGTANLASAFTNVNAEVLVVTDLASYALMKEALAYRAPKAKLVLLPEEDTETFIRSCIADFAPTHFISLERPGKAKDGHYHNMRGELIDDMITDSGLFLSESKRFGAVTISIGDGGNEMGMGTYYDQVAEHVPCGDIIGTAEGADLALASGVSNWWGWGIAALLSLQAGKNLLPSESEETELLHRVVLAGGVDGCTKENVDTIDNLPLDAHLALLRDVIALVNDQI